MRDQGIHTALPPPFVHIPFLLWQQVLRGPCLGDIPKVFHKQLGPVIHWVFPFSPARSTVPMADGLAAGRSARELGPFELE